MDRTEYLNQFKRKHEIYQQWLDSGKDVKATARHFGITESRVYTAIRKIKQQLLSD